MNNFNVITLVSWETRNWRHRDKAVQWCKNYGLKPVLRNMYIGKLYSKERDKLEKQFKGTFAKKTEKFFVSTLCRSCFEDSVFSGTLSSVKDDVDIESAFELIQISTNSAEH